jgi:diaminopimelate epimerase
MSVCQSILGAKLMMIDFTKMHGAGNDFVVIDAVTKAVSLSSEQIQTIANRHTGVGCDQVLVIEPPKRGDADFEYKIFNADGSTAGQCGNGARCVGRFIREQGLSPKQEITLQVGDCLRHLSLSKHFDVKAELGEPVFDLAAVPYVLPGGYKASSTEHELKLGSVTVNAGILSMGNPHAVIVVDDSAATPVAKIGPMIQALDVFPDSVNVGFMEIKSRDAIALRVFERGVGETLACGSGACAAVVHGIKLGLLSPEVTVDLPGGKLVVSWTGGQDAVWLSGPAETVFQGKVNLR